jgi:ABC-2 type transport system ATP-binding protein
LIHQPEVLFLDEPTFGVDPVSRRDLWLIIHEMVSSGTTVVVSTAYMDEAERFDRVALMHRGRLRAIDTPDALQQDMRGEILIVRVDKIREARTVVLEIPGVQSASVFGEALHVSVESAAAMQADIASRLRDAGFDVREIGPGVPGMEDVFIEHMVRASGGSDE